MFPLVEGGVLTPPLKSACVTLATPPLFNLLLIPNNIHLFERHFVECARDL